MHKMNKDECYFKNRVSVMHTTYIFISTGYSLKFEIHSLLFSKNKVKFDIFVILLSVQ